MKYQCKIIANRAIGKLQYKGKLFTKTWQDCSEDFSLTNSMLECRVIEKKNQ
jgi:hypothetical protein